MNKKYLLGIGIIIIGILIGFTVWRLYDKQQTSTSKSSIRNDATLPKEVIITLTKNGFFPNQVTIKVGSAVRWDNKSGSQETVNSDNYPTNQLYRQLNFGIFANGSSVTYTFKTPGVYGYHNQFHHEQEGKIIVVQ
jgi:plastocyanin